MRQWLIAVAVAELIVACSPTTAGRHDSLSLSISRDERRAAALRADIMRLQRLQTIQSECVSAATCLAKFESVKADIHAELAKCNGELANWEACNAERTSKTAKGAGLGCLAGWAFAAATGGAAAPAVVIGCGGGGLLGHGSASGSCVGTIQPPPCGTRQPVFETIALSRHGLAQMPQCQPEPPICAQLDSLLR